LEKVAKLNSLIPYDGFIRRKSDSVAMVSLCIW